MGTSHPVCLFALLLLLHLSMLILSCAGVTKTITVDQLSGRGDFKTVQSAVDSVPDGNHEWIRIFVKGRYRERVTIPKKKGYILLEGEGPWNTSIYFDAHAASNMRPLNGNHSATYDSATLTVDADNFVARKIAFRNAYNKLDSQAVAALVGGDKVAFYDVIFHGYQDTLCDYKGRHYYKHCLIEGSVDFIFGYARSIYDNCTIMKLEELKGWVTAHAQPDIGTGGFVFRGGEIKGSGNVYLGRPWSDNATVVYYGVQMTEVVVPEGWDTWKKGQDVSNVTFAEVGCTGTGSDTSGRVSWEKHLAEAEVQTFVDLKFIDDDGWISQLP